MIYFFAGAGKHGSHFQLYIITEGMKQKGIPYQPEGQKVFDNNNSEKAKILFDNLSEKPNEHFICKGHFLDKELLFSYPDIRIFLIWRKMGDVLVSRYHYLMSRYGRSFENFADFYKKDGRKHMFYQRSYQDIWRSVDHPKVFHVSYEGLRTDFQNAVIPMLEFANLTNVDISTLEETVSLERSRKKHNDPKGVLIRKGAVGEYKSIIPPEILSDMGKIMEMSPAQLKIQAFLNDPKVIIAKYYQYPGKSFVVRSIKIWKRLFSKNSQKVAKGPKLWWE